MTNKISIEIDLDEYDLRMYTGSAGIRFIAAFCKYTKNTGIVVAAEKNASHEVGHMTAHWTDKDSTDIWVPVNSIEFPKIKKYQWLIQGVCSGTYSLTSEHHASLEEVEERYGTDFRILRPIEETMTEETSEL